MTRARPAPVNAPFTKSNPRGDGSDAGCGYEVLVPARRTRRGRASGMRTLAAGSRDRAAGAMRRRGRHVRRRHPVAKEGWAMKPLLTTILLATDGSPAADEAGRAAVALAHLTGAALHVVHAW